MADPVTTNLKLIKPAVGDPSGANLWGDKLNQNFDKLDVAFGGFPPFATCRLSVSSTDPVPLGNIASSSNVYLLPYKGNAMPVADGSGGFKLTKFTATTQSLSDSTKSPAAAVANQLYDYFYWKDNSGNDQCTRGPAWTTSLGRVNALQYVQGVLTNSLAITNGPAAGTGVYVGTVGTNGTAGVDWIHGGSGPGGVEARLMVWNYFNRVVVAAKIQDTTVNGTGGPAGPRPYGTSNLDRVTFVSGLAEDAHHFRAMVSFNAASGFHDNAEGYLGFGEDSNNTCVITERQQSNLNTRGHLSLTYDVSPFIGQKFIQLMDPDPPSIASASVSANLGGGNPGQPLGVEGLFSFSARLVL